MKKSVSVFLIFLLLLLGSCHSDSPEEIGAPLLYPVRYRIRMNPEILPIQTKAMPVNDLPEPIEGESTASELYSTLEYVLYKYGDTEPVRKIRQHLGEEDFGSFVYDSLEAGSYTACFLAHSSDTVPFADNTFRFDTVGDAFFMREPFEVDGKEAKTVDVVLERIVSRIEFAAIDEVPSPVTFFTMNVLPVYNRFHLLEGPIKEISSPTLFRHVFTSEEKRKGVKNRHFFYTFVPEGEKISQIELTSLTAAGDTIRYRKVEEIPIALNKLVRYTGTLYTPGVSDATFEISILDGGAWGDTTEIILPKSQVRKTLTLGKHAE